MDSVEKPLNSLFAGIVLGVKDSSSEPRRRNENGASQDKYSAAVDNEIN